jgi:hypothetical protein
MGNNYGKVSVIFPLEMAGERVDLYVSGNRVGTWLIPSNPGTGNWCMEDEPRPAIVCETQELEVHILRTLTHLIVRIDCDPELEILVNGQTVYYRPDFIGEIRYELGWDDVPQVFVNGVEYQVPPRG